MATMVNLVNVWKNKSVGNSTKLRLIGAIVWPAATYGCESLDVEEIGGKLQVYQKDEGPSIKYVTLFWTNFDPSPPVTHCNTSRTSLKYVTHLGTPPNV